MNFKLKECFFTEKDHLLAQHEGIRVICFKYETGVAALRIENKRGNIIVLPYQGQQIWRCCIDGHELTMKSMFDEPIPTQDYLSTYGGFFLHCGATAIGVPSKTDTYPLHGELPNAPFKNAYISFGTDEAGSYVIIGGEYKHMVAFNYHYIACPEIKIYEDAGIFNIKMQVRNLMNREMELFYLAHINFRPVDHAELVYSANYDPESVEVYINVPEHIKTNVPVKDYKEFLNKLNNNPELHHILKPDDIYDPEVVMSIKYYADDEGLAHSLQVHPDGCSDYVTHQPSQLPMALRWISRTRDQDAMGLVLPATSGNNGYHAERAAGHYISLAPGEDMVFDMNVGLLTANETIAVRKKIKK